VEVGGLLEGVRGLQQRGFVEIVADQLQADRHAVRAEARRHAHAGQAGQAGRQREDVGEVGRDRVVALGADVTDSGVDVGPEGITGVEVRLTSKLSLVSGVVTDASGRPAPEATVIVYSHDRQHWMNLQNRRITSARVTSVDAHFVVSGLPGGRYLAVAVAEFDRGQWDPDNLERLRPLATPRLFRAAAHFVRNRA